jgi:hypothetical protein
LDEQGFSEELVTRKCGMPSKDNQGELRHVFCRTGNERPSLVEHQNHISKVQGSCRLCLAMTLMQIMLGQDPQADWTNMAFQKKKLRESVGCQAKTIRGSSGMFGLTGQETKTLVEHRSQYAKCRAHADPCLARTLRLIGRAGSSEETVQRNCGMPSKDDQGEFRHVWSYRTGKQKASLVEHQSHTSKVQGSCRLQA